MLETILLAPLISSRASPVECDSIALALLVL